MLGDKLRNLRKKNDLTLKSVGNKIKLAESTVGLHEQNRRMPDIPTLIEYAKLYHVSIDWLLDYKMTDDELMGMEEFRKLLVKKHIMSDGQDLDPKAFNSLLETFKIWKEVQDKK